MALLDSLRALLGRGTRYENLTYVGPTVSEVLGLGPEDLFRTQPHLRTVITFVARNVAQLPLQTFERVSDTDRRRVKDDPVAQLLSRPNPGSTGFELIYQLVADLKLYDVAIWLLVDDADSEAGKALYPIPPAWVQSTWGGTAWAPQGIEVVRPGSGKRTLIEGENLLLFHGYRPGDPASWASPVDALKQILAEQIQAWSYREQIWQRGGRVGAVLTRPSTAPAWSPEAREKFSRDWKAKWTGRTGPKAGGTPILEDGMELKNLRFNAREEEWSEVAKLSLATVAAVYHTSPTMVGILDNANYSNVKEFHQMLYTDTLGPDLAMIESRINAFLVPRVAKRDGLYVEFNVQAKMSGSFEEQAAVLSASVGAPWMSRNEARARLNMPHIEGGDDIVTPLNVITGGQASPRDSGSQNLASAPLMARLSKGALDMILTLGETSPDGAIEVLKALAGETPVSKAGPTITRASTSAPLKIKSGMREEDAAAAHQVLTRFFKRQRKAVISALGAKAGPAWWDEDRWNAELSDDLYALAMTVSQEIATDTLNELGIAPDLYSAERTAKFLRAVADSRAGAINSTTRDQIEAALAGELDEDAEGSTPEGVFDLAESSRAEQAGATLATTLAGFAVTEVASQMNRPHTTKTWVVTSANPRPSHAAMNGETVPMSEDFSNGAPWPGSAVLDVDEVAGCSCVVEITIP